MSMLRAPLHLVRDRAVRLAAARQFRPIDAPRNRIVLVRPDHFGDMLMVAPAVNAMSQVVTDDELVLMTGPWNSAVARHVTNLDQIVTFPFPGFERDDPKRGVLDPYRAINEAANMLRELSPRAVILMRDDHWWGGLMAREAGIPLRFGYANPTLEPFLTHPLDIRSEHYVRQNFELVDRSLSALGYRIPSDHEGAHDLRLRWPIEPQAATRAGKTLSGTVGQNDFIVIHPGAGAPVKQWPAQRWSAVAGALNRLIGARVVVTGTQDESSMCRAIADNASACVVNLAGQTSLFTLAEIFREARAVLGVDSGPLHLATAVGTSSIALYGPSDVTRYGPWGDSSRHRVVRADMQCPRCGDLSASRPEGCGCMMAITVDEVVRAAIEVLDYAR